MKKIKLQHIRIDSFVTTLDKEMANKIKGGDPLYTRLKCGSYVDACITARGCTINTLDGLC